MNALAGKQRPKNEPVTMDGLNRMLTATADEEIGCEEVFQLLDQYAEMVVRGEDPAILLPLVHHHLAMCRDCKEELEALLRALEGGGN